MKCQEEHDPIRKVRLLLSASLGELIFSAKFEHLTHYHCLMLLGFHSAIAGCLHGFSRLSPRAPIKGNQRSLTKAEILFPGLI